MKMNTMNKILEYVKKKEKNKERGKIKAHTYSAASCFPH
jgi:hypothetical protein